MRRNKDGDRRTLNASKPRTSPNGTNLQLQYSTPHSLIMAHVFSGVEKLEYSAWGNQLGIVTLSSAESLGLHKP